MRTEGMIAGFWAGFAFGFGYIVLARAGLLQLHAPWAVFIMFVIMISGFSMGQLRASKRYR